MTKKNKLTYTYKNTKINILSFLILILACNNVIANDILELSKEGKLLKFIRTSEKISPHKAVSILSTLSPKKIEPNSRKNNQQEIWLEINLNTKLPKPDILYFDDFFIDSISFYKIHPSGELSRVSTQGLLTSLKNRPLKSEFPAIPIEYEKNNDTKYLIHLNSKKFFHIKLKATSFETFFNHKLSFNRYEAFFLSCNFFLIIMCIFLFFNIKKKHLLIYTGYLIAFFLYFGTSSLYKIFDVSYSNIYQCIFDYIYLLVNGLYYLYICKFIEENNPLTPKKVSNQIKYYPLVVISTIYLFDVFLSETKILSYLIAQILIYLSLGYTIYSYYKTKNKYILATLIAAAIFALGTLLKTGSDLNIIQSPWEDFYLGAVFQPIALIDMLFFALIIIIHYKETITENKKSIDTIAKISTEKADIELQIEQLTHKKAQLKIESNNSQKEHKELIHSLIVSQKGSQSISYYYFSKLFNTDASCEELIKKFIPNTNLTCKKCQVQIDLNNKTCNNCSKEISVLNYSVFKNIRFPLQKALFLSYKYYNEREDINYTQVAKKLDMNKKTVWNFCFKLEEKIKRGDFRNWTEVIVDI